uniref:Uncharacterized protein n=1 Tax=Romanomermis culicivorax TaxID=13658 RepID=A0A915JB45_ROMCU
MFPNDEEICRICKALGNAGSVPHSLPSAHLFLCQTNHVKLSLEVQKCADPSHFGYKSLNCWKIVVKIGKI